MKRIRTTATVLIVGMVVMTQTPSAFASDASIAASSAPQTRPASGAESIRPFRAHFPDEALVDLKRRIAATRWPDRETVPDRFRGLRLHVRLRGDVMIAWMAFLMLAWFPMDAPVQGKEKGLIMAAIPRPRDRGAWYTGDEFKNEFKRSSKNAHGRLGTLDDDT